ncbi:hypothetical protein, partial [Caballeronia sp. INML1]|uniref:hypothetical protein n=1 Tax=Caballeronia sp. INML1 TaxID=2921760 RepID=UPI0020290F30
MGYFFGFASAFAGSRFLVGLLALPLCGAAVTFFAAAKKATVLRVKCWVTSDRDVGDSRGC